MIRIVLADDHAVIRHGLAALLAAQPDFAVVAEASNGAEAVRTVPQFEPDVVVMDVAMPVLNGIEATRQLIQGGAETRIVILSMHGTAEHVHQALRAGALGYLHKESAGRELVAAVRAVAAGRQYLCEKVRHLLPAAESERSPLEQLSARERQVLQWVVEGHTSADIAGSLSLSVKTVESYRSRLMQKLGVEDLPALVKFAIANGVTPLHSSGT